MAENGALMKGKRGLVMGVANDHSIAWAIAQFVMSEGGECGFTHLPDRPDDERQRVLRPLIPASRLHGRGRLGPRSFFVSHQSSLPARPGAYAETGTATSRSATGAGARSAALFAAARPR